MEERVRARVTEELAEREKERLAELLRERKKLEVREAEVRHQEEELLSKVESQVRERLPGLRAAARQQLEEDRKVEMEALLAQLQLAKDHLATSQKEELNLRQRTAALEQEKRELDVLIARQVAEERGKLQSEHTLELRQKEEVLESLRREISDLKQRSEQGSQQLQGEVQELELEDMLRETFPNDGFDPVPKGKEGADVLQIVRHAPGHHFGKILWESKRTKEWSKDWVSKVKKDQSDVVADIAVIVTRAMPEDVPTFGDHAGVVVTSFRYVVPLAALLRSKVVDLSKARQANVGRSDKKEMLYSYVTGNEFLNAFRNAVEASAEVITELQSERMAMAKRWKRRQKLIERNLQAIAEVYGSVQGLVGASLPEIPALNLEPMDGSVQLSLPDGEEEDEPAEKGSDARD